MTKYSLELSTIFSFSSGDYKAVVLVGQNDSPLVVDQGDRGVNRL